MPWGERERAFYSYSGVSVDERTLRNWCSKLVKQNAIAKVGGSSYWKKEAYKAAWSAAYPLLWGELNCCYYCCKGFQLGAFTNNEIMYELLELTRQISGKEEKLTL